MHAKPDHGRNDAVRLLPLTNAIVTSAIRHLPRSLLISRTLYPCRPGLANSCLDQVTFLRRQNHSTCGFPPGLTQAPILRDAFRIGLATMLPTTLRSAFTSIQTGLSGWCVGRDSATRSGATAGTAQTTLPRRTLLHELGSSDTLIHVSGGNLSGVQTAGFMPEYLLQVRMHLYYT
jgi:hypothetical protein